VTAKGTPRPNPVQPTAALRIAIEQAIARGEPARDTMDRLGVGYQLYDKVRRAVARTAAS